jgi:hypothetical protein
MNFFKFYENIKSEAVGNSKIWVVYHYDYEGRRVTGKTFYSNEAAAKSQDGPWSTVGTQEVIGDYKPGQPIYSTTSYFYGDPGDKGHTTYYANKEDAAKGGDRVDTHQVFSSPDAASAHAEEKQAKYDAEVKSRVEREIAKYPTQINQALNETRDKIAKLAEQLQSASVGVGSAEDINATVKILHALKNEAQGCSEYLRNRYDNYQWNLKQQKE